MQNQTTQDSAQTLAHRSSLSAWPVRAVAHSAGVMTVAGLMLLPYVSRQTLEIFWTSAQHKAFLQLAWLDTALFLGLAACLWALVVILFEIVTARRAPLSRVLRLQRGSVLTETLIVLPIFLLLTFGIAQLAINNIAGMLTNAAVFQAGRTAWLWSSEADARRMGVSLNMAKEKARVQAAAVLTPVAPGEYVQTLGSGTAEFRQMRGILIGSQVPSFSANTGQIGMTMAPALMLGDNMMSTTETNSSFTRALDTTSWRQRTARKFSFAYQATDVKVTNSGNQINVELTYSHHQGFPLVGKIFGDSYTMIGGRPGYYAKITRHFSMRKQLAPNKRTP